jgi:hypothetical protein
MLANSWLILCGHSFGAVDDQHVERGFPVLQLQSRLLLHGIEDT